ncbi:MAG: agmatinase [Microbacteriaceae bacterium]|nr:agmatinase [Microbacteriaceae bacterium]
MAKKVPRTNSGDNIGQVDATVVPRFSGLATFARLPRLDEVTRAEIAVVGIPFDAGASYRPGARFGPAHIRESSRLLRPYNPSQDASPFVLAQVVDAGDIAVNPFNIELAVKQIEEGVDELLEAGMRLVTLGGDHTIAYPILKALHKKHGPITVIHFDAHLDTWDTYFGAPLTHGTPFRRASEDGFIDLESCLHVGIRGPLYASTDLSDDKKLGFEVLTSIDMDKLGVEGVIKRMLSRVGSKPVYISIDVDVLDPAFAPGTGTPEMGGLSSREMLALLRSLETVNVIGADIVEVSPQYDNAQITGIAAAHMAYELITLMARTQK